MGGVLARPAVKYPDFFPPGSLFDTFPYLLPPLISTSVILLGFVFGFFFLQESKKFALTKVRPPRPRHQCGWWLAECFC